MNYEILCKNNLVVNSKFGPIVVNKKDTIISNAIINYGYYNTIINKYKIIDLN